MCQAERQFQKEQDADVRHQLDQQIDDIRALLLGSGSADPATDKLTKDNQAVDKDYDQNVRELVLDKRAKPKDRTKTEDELAIEAKEALEKAERRRQKRMRGEADESSDDERGGGKRSAKRDRGGDDLEDDFVDDDDELHGLGVGLEGKLSGEYDERGESDDSEDGGVNSNSEESEGEEDEGEEDEEDSEIEEGNEEQDEDVPTTARTQKHQKSSHKKLKNKELPFTFPCPESHEDFLSVIEDIEEEQVPTVVQRIRTLHHASLAVENKFKLQVRTPHYHRYKSTQTNFRSYSGANGRTN